MKIINKDFSQDGSIKYTFNIPEKGNLESIYFTFNGKYRGDLINDTVICLSSQIGCKIACPFCATGKMKERSNLDLLEMNKEIELIQNDLTSLNLPRANYYALMGMGEPLLNTDNVKKFFEENINDVNGISLSTAGIPDKIKEIAYSDNLDFLLYISLHTPYDSQRDKLVPINKNWPIKDVLDAGRIYSIEKKEKTILTYMIMPNVNDTLEHARDLSLLVNPEYFLVQLTCFNPLNEKDIPKTEKNFDDSILLFTEALKSKGIEHDAQTSKGKDIKGGCGQLEAR
tara:strand:- start:2486 stop:3340 length:855 start_codon:yes stop_codon:yes gene_type:complete